MKQTLLALCLLITGCATTGAVTRPAAPVLDQALLQPCEQLQPIPSTATIEQVALHHLETIYLYRVCARKQAAGIEALQTLTSQQP